MNTLALARTASHDPTLSAVVVAQQPLYYADGPDPALDRPSHVRAGSSLAWVPGGIAVLQDDANFLAIVDPNSGRVRSVSLPAGEGGVRQFDQTRGNKRSKLDLEACVAIEHDGATLLVAFGSGSTPRREQVLVVRHLASDRPEARLLYAEGLYALLRSAAGFAPGRLNIEGAVVVGDSLRLFSRGNGKIRHGERPVNATCDLPLAPLMSHLLEHRRHPAPEATAVTTYALGSLDGVPLSFTDAALRPEGILFTAAAEASPDAVDDGPVTGSVIGIIEPTGRVRWTPIVDATGAPFTGKVEGVVTQEGTGRLRVIVDADDPDAASVLCTVELRGL